MDSRCSGYVLYQKRENLPTEWLKIFDAQTLCEVILSDSGAFWVVVKGLPQHISTRIPVTLLETLAWGLMVRPHCDIIIQPLYVSLNSSRPSFIYECSISQLSRLISKGFIAIMRTKTIASFLDNMVEHEINKNQGKLRQPEYSIEVVTRALLEEKEHIDSDKEVPPPVSNYSIHPAIDTWIHRIKNRLSVSQKVWIKRQIDRFLGRKKDIYIPEPAHTPLAAMKSWEPAFYHPHISVRYSEKGNRIPILMALHWLELGGAEKFAVDLIKSLPKDKYAIYVTTDVQSENTWADEIADKVEEIIHLPEFLVPHMEGIFYTYYIRTRGIKLLHIHHAPRAYESLFHIRRFHPKLVVLDTFHIIELPPHSGGYPELACRDFGVFIDHHHVISRHLQQFLIQRWLVPQDRIHVFYLNVDTDKFNPDLVQKGKVRSKYGISDNDCVIGFIGRLVNQKKPLEFIKMAEILIRRHKTENKPESLHFLIVGSGPMLNEVKTAVRAKGLDSSIHFHGEVSDTLPVYKDIDILAMPSENEGLALVTYEAMAMQVPVFFTDVGAQSEILKPEFLVPSGENIASNMAEALWSFVIDKHKRIETGKQLRQYILENHRAENTFSQIIKLYESMV